MNCRPWRRPDAVEARLAFVVHAAGGSGAGAIHIDNVSFKNLNLPDVADADGDGDVDGADFLDWQRKLGARRSRRGPRTAISISTATSTQPTWTCGKTRQATAPERRSPAERRRRCRSPEPSAAVADANDAGRHAEAAAGAGERAIDSQERRMIDRRSRLDHWRR